MSEQPKASDHWVTVAELLEFLANFQDGDVFVPMSRNARIAIMRPNLSTVGYVNLDLGNKELQVLDV